MEKATKAIRRSGVRLKSISGGHGDIQMIISQLGEVRSSFKAFALAQSETSEDALRWASKHENRAIGETFSYLAELSLVWSMAQQDFADQLKEYKSLYELILEGEKHVTQARETLVAREQREAKIRKEYKKASKKAPVEEVRILKERLNQAERSRDLAHLEVVERVGENEAVKMIRIKEGLLKVGAAYRDMAQKAMIVFSAHQGVTSELPEVHDKDLHDVKYTGSNTASKYVREAREQVRSYCGITSPGKPPLPDDPPPPYTPSLEHLNDLSNSRQNGNSYNKPSSINSSSSEHSSMNGHLRPNGIIPNASHPNSSIADNQPSAPNISSSTINSPLPNSPSSHIYPVLPVPHSNVHPSTPNSSGHPTHHSTPNSAGHPTHHSTPNSAGHPSMPNSSVEPDSPGDNVTHFQSVPNLGDGLSPDHGFRYTPLSVGEISSFNDSSFHPDTSSSSPSLLANHLPKTSTPADSPPFNPYYDWLPSHITNKFNTAADKPENKAESKVVSPPKGDTSKESNENKGPGPGSISVRPKRNLNPFLECSDDEADTGV